MHERTFKIVYFMIQLDPYAGSHKKFGAPLLYSNRRAFILPSESTKQNIFKRYSSDAAAIQAFASLVEKGYPADKMVVQPVEEFVLES